jgi:F0F1-type ATP synthase assembly protein I
MLLGLWLDARWDTRPWLALLGVLLGIGAGFYNFFRVVLGTTKG